MIIFWWSMGAVAGASSTICLIYTHKLLASRRKAVIVTEPAVTVAELIEQLRKSPPDAAIFIWGGGGAEPRVPAAEYCDWGEPDSPEAGVYLS
jgi:hypothetical protein